MEASKDIAIKRKEDLFGLYIYRRATFHAGRLYAAEISLTEHIDTKNRFKLNTRHMASSRQRQRCRSNVRLLGDFVSAVAGGEKSTGQKGPVCSESLIDAAGSCYRPRIDGAFLQRVAPVSLIELRRR